MKNKSQIFIETREKYRDLVSATEVAAQFGICPRTFWAGVHRGDFPKPIQVGPRLFRWSTKGLQAWIDAGCPKAEGTA